LNNLLKINYSEDVKGKLCLLGYKITKKDKEGKTPEYHIILSTPGKELVLRAETELIRDDWIKHLTIAINQKPLMQLNQALRRAVYDMEDDEKFKEFHVILLPSQIVFLDCASGELNLNLNFHSKAELLLFRASNHTILFESPMYYKVFLRVSPTTVS
jgi:hypothetical protein